LLLLGELLMKMRNLAVAAIASITMTIALALPSLADPAVLVGERSGSRVNVRSSPTTQSSSPHYGLVGDYIEVLSETRGDDGYTWCYIRFSSGAEGWVRSDFVSDSSQSSLRPSNRVESSLYNSTASLKGSGVVA
jgi:SH3-like domain-containing protein